jgi:hypothetical protein
VGNLILLTEGSWPTHFRNLKKEAHLPKRVSSFVSGHGFIRAVRASNTLALAAAGPESFPQAIDVHPTLTEKFLSSTLGFVSKKS